MHACTRIIIDQFENKNFELPPYRFINIEGVEEKFHNFGLNEKILGKNLKIIAFSKDGNIECFIHKKFKITGIMWHPERNNKISKIDSKLFKSLF